MLRRVTIRSELHVLPGDVLYATPNKRGWAAFYRFLGLVHAALAGSSLSLVPSARQSQPSWIFDSVALGRRKGVHKKPLNVFVNQFRTRWHAWMPDLTEFERTELLRIAERWDGRARWHLFRYKEPNEQGCAYFNCLGFVEYCYEQIGRDIYDDHASFHPSKHLRAFRLDRYAYQRRR